MSNLLRDLSLAIRSLTKHPLFAAIAIVTIALGIGANTAIFSVVNGVLLRPLPYESPEELVIVWSSYPDNPKFPVSAAEYLDYRSESEAFADMGTYTIQSVTVTGTGLAERRTAAYSSSSLFGVLGTQPTLGRTFTADEDLPGGPNVAILSHGYWIVCESVRRLGALGPDILKVQFPVDTSGPPDPAEWADACAELNEASPVPWALLSGGDPFESFAEQVRIACEAG